MGDEIILIVVSTPDVASLNQGEELLKLGEWIVGPQVEGFATWQRANVRIWWFGHRLLEQDDLDKRWFNATSESVTEVIFPSRHVAASGQASLTVHPIGVMYYSPDEEVPFGGKAGFAPPPSPRLGAWFRQLLAISDEKIRSKFEISLEVTHHGPWLEAPSLFIEIGSTESDWPHRGAARELAEVIWCGLGLDGGKGSGKWDGIVNSGEKVVIGFGGGHYAKRLCDVVSNEGIWLGHMLANYALEMVRPDDDKWQPEVGNLPSGKWQMAVEQAILSTRQAFPQGDLWAYLDRKSFKGWQRQSLRLYLEHLGIPIGRTRDLLASE